VALLGDAAFDIADLRRPCVTRFLQTDTDGAGNEGSLNVPTGMPKRIDPISRVQQTVAPQFGQKW
jgi:hypothetical protein